VLKVPALLAELQVVLLAGQHPELPQEALPQEALLQVALLQVAQLRVRQVVQQEQLLGLLVRLLEQLELQLVQLALLQEPRVPPPQEPRVLLPLQQPLVRLLLPQLLLQWLR